MNLRKLPLYAGAVAMIFAALALLGSNGGNPFTGKPTPSPSASASPTPTPQPTPTPIISHIPRVTGTYWLGKCQVYNGKKRQPDPIANAILSQYGTDPNGPSVIATAAPHVTFSSGDNAGLEVVNLANNSTPMLTINTVPGGHSPPFSPGAYGGGSNAQIPWCSTTSLPGCPNGPFQIENTNAPNDHDQYGSGDGHTAVLNQDTCVLYQAGGARWANTGGSNGTFSAYNGFTDNLFTDYDNQGTPWSQNKGDNVTVSGTGVVNFTDYDDYFGARTINHPIGMILPTSVVVCYNTCGSMGVNYSPGTGGDGACSVGPTKCFIYGDIVWLPLTYICPTGDDWTYKFCLQLKTQGAVVQDTGSSPTFRFGYGLDGTHTYDPTLWSYIHSLPLSAFVLACRGCLTPP